VVVQNIEGAAGNVAASYLARRAAPDGLTLAVPGRSWFIEGIVERSGNLFEPGKLSYIGSPGAVNSVLYVRSRTGIKSSAELKSSARPLVFGALGGTTPTAMVPALLAADGWPIKVVLGYVSTARVLLRSSRTRSTGSSRWRIRSATGRT
jgi:tripartite-type tricarboxylate transporter receptor subunit TctC